MRITGCDIWPLQCPTCNPSTMHGVLLGWDHFKGGIIFKSPYWHPTYTSIYSFNNNRGPGNAASDVLTSAGGEGDEVRAGRWKEEAGGVCRCATRRKFPSLRPSKQSFSPETKGSYSAFVQAKRCRYKWFYRERRRVTSQAIVLLSLLQKTICH